ncbi:hypothetical protein NA57DRAFT_61046 [Rhizodiscina lignyota]|uniref:Uncharacterized protein n=1 Tax=Rhizodiscina lignyota TaxID=1504668 RepID=A0A9P4I4S9_9PEZI|nr:hypothetical protein NA57DRAFT_61046 [Rhizodiscina lignyota]
MDPITKETSSTSIEPSSTHERTAEIPSIETHISETDSMETAQLSSEQSEGTQMMGNGETHDINLLPIEYLKKRPSSLSGYRELQTSRVSSITATEIPKPGVTRPDRYALSSHYLRRLIDKKYPPELTEWSTHFGTTHPITRVWDEVSGRVLRVVRELLAYQQPKRDWPYPSPEALSIKRALTRNGYYDHNAYVLCIRVKDDAMLGYPWTDAASIIKSHWRDIVRCKVFGKSFASVRRHGAQKLWHALVNADVVFFTGEDEDWFPAKPMKRISEISKVKGSRDWIGSIEDGGAMESSKTDSDNEGSAEGVKGCRRVRFDLNRVHKKVRFDFSNTKRVENELKSERIALALSDMIDSKPNVEAHASVNEKLRRSFNALKRSDVEAL